MKVRAPGKSTKGTKALPDSTAAARVCVLTSGELQSSEFTPGDKTNDRPTPDGRVDDAMRERSCLIFSESAR